MLGNVYTRLTVIGKTGTPNYYRCKCECGNFKNVRSDALKSGNTQSCGCLHRELVTTHGHSVNAVNRRTSEYSSWDHMLQRCSNSKHKAYSDYGGRGIRVCDSWLNSFENFIADMGMKPNSTYSIDRIDVNGNYEPANCRWASKKLQIQNRRKTIYIKWMGVEFSLTNLAALYRISPGVLNMRIRKGWDMKRALSEPVDKSKSHRKAKPCKPNTN